ncbi:putative Heterokaryon incompatibility domain-containing protein [Seiridium cardinale]
MARRRTTRPEGMAYCLFGIFDIQLLLIYGEGTENAMSRLDGEIKRRSGEMRLEELYVAAQVHSRHEDAFFLDRSKVDVQFMHLRIVNISKGLVEQTRSENPTMQFIHESVRDFLVTDQGLRGLWAELNGGFEAETHDRLATRCVEQLRVEMKHGVPIAESFPFLDYAIKNVLYHANDSQGCGVSQLKLLEQFPLDRWLSLRDAVIDCTAKRYSPVGQNQADFAKNFLNMTTLNFGLGDRSGRTPLSSAASLGDKAMFKLLLATTKVHPDFDDINGRTLLSYAAENGHKEVVEPLLLINVVDPDSRDLIRRAPLSHAAGRGHNDVIELLLSTRKVDPHSSDLINVTPMSHAAIYDHRDVFNLLNGTKRRRKA